MAELNELTINGSNYTFEDDVARGLATTEASRAQAAEQSLQTAINNKVDKVTGKGLSTNDYTNDEKAKLAGLNNYDDTQVRQLIAQTNANFANYYTKAESYSAAEVDTLLRTQRQGQFVPVNTLPTPSADTMFKIYLVPSTNPETQNVKDEFVTLENNGTYSWEQIGTTAVDLSGYSTTVEMNAAIASALASYYTKSEVDEALGGKQNTIDDLANIRSGAQAGSTAYQKPQGGIPSTDMSQDVQASLEKADTALQEHQSLDAYAKVDGYYEGMGVGTADNLTGQTERTNDAVYRKTGGSEEVASGTATITNIKGNTVAWNQLIGSMNYTSGTTQNGITIQGNGVYKISGTSTDLVFLGIANKRITFIGRHKYYFGGMHGGNFNSYRLWIESSSAFPAGHRLFVEEKPMIRTALNTESLQAKSFYLQVVRAGITIGTTISPTLFDLTLIYGAGNEPTTVEQFEADYFKWFGKPLTYEPYDAGSLRSVQLESLKTTGFNLWDGQATNNKAISYMTGELLNADNVCVTDYIRVLPSTNYYTTITSLSSGGYGMAFYDANKNYISGIRSGGGFWNQVFTTPTGCYYIRLSLAASEKSTACINLSGDRNGEYEPYEEHSVSLPVTTITGKLNGEGESVVVFPDGMKSAGSAYDEIYTVGDKTYAVKRVNSVNLGALPWQISGNYIAATNSIPTATDTNNNICPIYETVPLSYLNSSMDKTLGIGSAHIYARDTAYSDATAFKTAMNGVMLYYELATPQVYELDTFDLPKPYQVDAGGTEEQIQKSGVQGLAAILTCIYGVDAVKILDKLPQNYISEKSMDNFLAQLNTVTGGTWTKTWNDSTGEWDFSFQSSQVEPTNNQDETI